MPIPKILGAQRDFSAGELDESAKRADENPIVKTGGRQMSNWRILNERVITNRPGRLALFGASAGRTEEVTMPGGAVFFLHFGTAELTVRNSAGTDLLTATTLLLTPNGSPVAIPWTASTVGGIVWAQIGRAIFITYPDGAPNNVPQVLSFDGVATWTLAPYSEQINPSQQKRTLFYRISPPNIQMQPSATSGNINIVFSAAVLVAGMVGTRLQYCGRQLTITGVSDTQHGTATVNQTLPPGQTLSYTTLNGAIHIGDVVIGATTGAQGIVVANAFEQQLVFVSAFAYMTPGTIGDTITQAATTSTGLVVGSNYYFDGSLFRVWLTVSVSAGAFTTGGPVVGPLNTVTPAGVTTLNTSQITVQLIPTGAGDASQIVQFAGTETVAGPSGSFAMTANAVVAPQAVDVWDNEVMNLYRGYPSSVFADQSRLGFTNFADVPTGIAWSAIGLPFDLFVGALPGDAIFELAPDNSQVFYVIAGMESAEFVFTDRAIYYIPITPTFPLEPGSVAFNKLSDYGCLPKVQPRRAEQSIIYIKAGGTVVGAVQAPGAYYRPYVVDNISELHSHLFTGLNPIAIAIPSGPSQFAELYIYVLLQNGNLVVGRYSMRQGLLEPGPEGKPAVGWLPWNGIGNSTWVAARQSDVIFNTIYPGATIVEQLDNTQHLDGAIFYNNVPPPFTPPGGKGPFWFFPGPNTTVFLYDGARPMDTYAVDGNGFLVPQFIGGENLASPTLIAGQAWTAILEPFTPEAPPGQSTRQRLLRRRITYLAVRVTDSTGFVMARLFSTELTRTSPAYGTIVNTRRVPAYNADDDATAPPPLREEVQRWRPIGRAHDPRIAVIKDTPGPLLIHELGIEVTI